MFEHYKNRMTRKGSNIGEMLRMQSNMVIEHTWMNDPNARRVYVVKTTRGLPRVTAKHELIDVKFNVDTYQKFGSDEPAYHLQFRHGAEKHNPDIGVGSYVYMEDEDGEWKWWLLTSLDERPAFRQYTINECNWKLGWVADGKIYYTLGVLRNGSTMSEADTNTYTSTVSGNAVFLTTTNSETQLIGHNQRFLISDAGRMPPLAFSVGSISDTRPLGLTKFVLTQTVFDVAHDNADLMLASYYSDGIEPIEPEIEKPNTSTFEITYSGTKPTIKVGGSPKVFTAQLASDNYFDIMWTVSDGKNTYGGGYDNYTQTFDDYIITAEDRNVSIRVASNYNLIGTILTISAECADGSTGSAQVEVIG